MSAGSSSSISEGVVNLDKTAHGSESRNQFEQVNESDPKERKFEKRDRWKGGAKDRERRERERRERERAYKRLFSVGCSVRSNSCACVTLWWMRIIS